MALALPLALVLSGCGSEPEPEPTPTPTPTAVGPRTLVAAGFDDQEIGPKIVGPQGPEVSAIFTSDAGDIAEIISYVACPPVEGLDLSEEDVPEGEDLADFASECRPDMWPEGTVYTYVHRVTPTQTAQSPVTVFRTARPATGFANTIGFDREQAEAALGEGYSIGTQIDNGMLVWRIEKGDGWDAGEEITFFWQSELPPEGPAEAYEIETTAGRAEATGPFPPAEMPEESGDEAAQD
ncbi:hypothetical protein D6201_02720 [Aurantiacibacter aquimixticola]|uniref:Uncharacterized protein n=1 Tax=Aurantiacibacter aquimixticola TaxID=1958945 RepID=A0A419RWK7_9SPHN|nr:hypothetical protein D6201_02720 [Aurantiacibacter aquimixticola]